jgi:hypothetical protein
MNGLHPGLLPSSGVSCTLLLVLFGFLVDHSWRTKVREAVVRNSVLALRPIHVGSQIPKHLPFPSALYLTNEEPPEDELALI